MEGDVVPFDDTKVYRTVIGSDFHIFSSESEPRAGTEVSTSRRFKNWSMSSTGGRGHANSIELKSNSPIPCSEIVSVVSNGEGDEKVNAGGVVGVCSPGCKMSCNQASI